MSYSFKRTLVLIKKCVTIILVLTTIRLNTCVNMTIYIGTIDFENWRLTTFKAVPLMKEWELAIGLSGVVFRLGAKLLRPKEPDLVAPIFTEITTSGNDLKKAKFAAHLH